MTQMGTHGPTAGTVIPDPIRNPCGLAACGICRMDRSVELVPQEAERAKQFRAAAELHRIGCGSWRQRANECERPLGSHRQPHHRHYFNAMRLLHQTPAPQLRA